MRNLLAFTLCIVMLVLSVIPAGAITLETVEDAVESVSAEAVTDAALTSTTELDVPMYTRYGKLVIYQNWEQENAKLGSFAYVDSDYIVTTPSVSTQGTITEKIVTTDPVDPTNGNHAVSIKGSSWRQFFVDFNMNADAGKYTFQYDYYANTKCSWMERYFTSFKPYDFSKKAYYSAGDLLSVTSSLEATSVWTTRTAKTLVLTEKTDTSENNLGKGIEAKYGTNTAYFYPEENKAADLKFTQIGIMPSGTDYYLDNLAFYYHPDNAIVYQMGKNFDMKFVEGDTYTFPTAPEVNAAWTGEFYGWMIDNKLYKPGETVAASVVAGKSAEALTIPEFDEAKGILLAYFTFESAASISTPTYYNSEFVPNGCTGFGQNNGMSSISLYEETPGNRVFNVYNQNGSDSFRFGVFEMKSTLPGNYTVSFDGRAIEDGAYPGVAMTKRITGGFIRFNSGAVDIGYTSFGTDWTKISKYRNVDNFTGFGINVYAGKIADKSYYLTDFYIDNISLYCMPSNRVYFKSDKKATDYEYRAESEGKITFPTLEALGYEADADFVCWTSTSGGYYKAGDVADIADVGGKIFYPFVQDASVPAVISLYEGDKALSVDKTSYTAPIIDDGRTVLHVHGFGSTWSINGDKYSYMTDPRAALKAPAKFDAAEYRTISFMAKVTSAYKADNSSDKNSTYSPASSTYFTIYNYVNEKFSYNANSKIGTYSYPVDSKYHVTEIDMSNQASGATYPWVNTGWGFALDINCVSWGGDTYLDYVRVYRNGLTTVTYDTNAPTGATVISEVEAETGRGLGTGYLLTGERPEVEGYKFLGWSEEKNSGVTVESVDLTGDKTVYAVWASTENGTLYAAPSISNEISFREDIKGIRFLADVTDDNKGTLNEYGMLIARGDLLGEKALTFDFKKNGVEKAEDAPLYVVGTAYKKNDVDNYYDKDEITGEITYSVVCVNIPDTNYDTKLVARTYAKYLVNGREVTVYGGTSSASYNEAKGA